MHTHIPKPHAGKPGDIHDITEQLLVKSLALSVKIDSQRGVYRRGVYRRVYRRGDVLNLFS